MYTMNSLQFGHIYFNASLHIIYYRSQLTLYITISITLQFTSCRCRSLLKPKHYDYYNITIYI